MYEIVPWRPRIWEGSCRGARLGDTRAQLEQSEGLDGVLSQHHAITPACLPGRLGNFQKIAGLFLSSSAQRLLD